MTGALRTDPEAMRAILHLLIQPFPLFLIITIGVAVVVAIHHERNHRDD